MKKLMTFCFVILFSVLSALSCFNYAFDTIDRIEGDKVSIVIEKTENVTNADFLNEIDTALADKNVDIMFRNVSEISGKSVYSYYKTNHSTEFLKISTNAPDIQLDNDECISTMEQDGYTTFRLRAASLLQEISFFSWEQAANCDLSAGTYYVEQGQQDAITEIIRTLGYNVTINDATYISGRFSVPLFSFVPAFMLIASMVFYVLSNGKKNVLMKMEGYTTINIFLVEIKTITPVFLTSFIMVEIVTLIAASFLYKGAFGQFFVFSLPNILLLAVVVITGTAFSAWFICCQKSAEHMKGKVPRRGIYITTVLAKMVFVSFIMFFLTIAVRNVYITCNTISTADFLKEKVENYVTLPATESNTSTERLADNYKAFYSATVERYDGILVDAGNYEYDLISGRTLAEEYGQDSITVNRNYLKFNPIYDVNGSVITDGMLSCTKFNVLLPASKQDEMSKYQERVQTAYSMDVDFIVYDDLISEIYSYNATTGTGAYGKLDAPVILVVEEENLHGLFVLSYCTKGSYFLNVPSDDPYQELLPVLQETGIDTVTLSAPYISSTFADTIRQQTMMLVLYGTQSILLVIGLVCLILFSAKLYCENYKRKIACCMIEGYSVLSCMKKHLIVTMFYCTGVILALCVISIAMQVSLNYSLFFLTFAVEVMLSLGVSKSYAQRNLYHIVKGAD